MDLDDLLDKFTEITEIKAYANAQHATITELQRKLEESSNKIKHLEELLKATAPNISTLSVVSKDLLSVGKDQEEICKLELAKLKEQSMQRVLTLEEAKKTEIYTKLLLSLENKDKGSNSTLDNLTDEQLLKLAEDATAKNQ